MLDWIFIISPQLLSFQPIEEWELGMGSCWDMQMLNSSWHCRTQKWCANDADFMQIYTFKQSLGSVQIIHFNVMYVIHQALMKSNKYFPLMAKVTESKRWGSHFWSKFRLAAGRAHKLPRGSNNYSDATCCVRGVTIC